MNELSLVEKTRILEYQNAFAFGGADRLKDAEEKLLALGIEPEEALRTEIDWVEVAGDR